MSKEEFFFLRGLVSRHDSLYEHIDIEIHKAQANIPPPVINFLIEHELEELTKPLVGLGRHILDIHMCGQFDGLPSSGGVAKESLLVGVEKKHIALQRPKTGTPFL